MQVTTARATPEPAFLVTIANRAGAPETTVVECGVTVTASWVGTRPRRTRAVAALFDVLVSTTSVGAETVARFAIARYRHSP